MVHSRSRGRILCVLIWALITSFKSHFVLPLLVAVDHSVPLIPGLLSGSIVSAQSHYGSRLLVAQCANKKSPPHFGVRIGATFEVWFQYHEFANRTEPGTEVGMGINVSLIDIHVLLMIFLVKGCSKRAILKRGLWAVDLKCEI